MSQSSVLSGASSEVAVKKEVNLSPRLPRHEFQSAGVKSSCVKSDVKKEPVNDDDDDIPLVRLLILSAKLTPPPPTCRSPVVLVGLKPISVANWLPSVL